MTSIAEQTDSNQKPRHRTPKDVGEWTRASRDAPKEELSPLARHTLMTLASYADWKGTNCRPSYQKIGEAMGRSRAAAGKGLDELARKGWIERRSITVHGRRATLFVPRIPEPETTAKSSPLDDAHDPDEAALSSPRDGTRPAHGTQPTQDQPSKDGECVEFTDWDLPVTDAENLWASTGQVVMTALSLLGAPLDRIEEEFRARPQKVRQLDKRVSRLLMSGIEDHDLLRTLTDRSAPKPDVDTFLGLLLSRSRKVQPLKKARASA